MKRAFLISAVLGTMVYGAFLSFNYDAQKAASSPVPNLAVNSKTKIASTVPSIIVPLAAESTKQRQELFSKLAEKTAPKRVVLVAGNSDSRSEQIKIFDGKWALKHGEATNDREVFDSLTSEKYAISDNGSFADREDLKAIVNDINAIFEDAVYSTLLLPSDLSATKTQSLADFIYEGDSEAMVVAAIDTAPDLPISLARVHLGSTLQALASGDSKLIFESDCDSPSSLLLASEFSKRALATNLHSGQNDSDQFLAYWDKVENEKIEKSSSFIVAGDSMFDRNVWHNFKNVGIDKIFDQLPANLFRGVDLSMLNHEGPVSTKPIDDDYKSGSMVFNFPPAVPEVLSGLGIKAVSLANNHSSNAGTTGFANTQKVLSAANIANFGRQTGFDAKEDIIHQNGAIPLSIIGIDTLAKYDEKAFLAAIKKEKADGFFVIIYPHWGEEYKTVHNASQAALAKKWIDAGAGMIIGSHPHVVQDFEVIKGVPVVYSLGNFVFDQFFSEDTQHGLIIAGTISEKKISLSFLPTKEVVVKPQLLSKTDKSVAISKIIDLNTAAGFTKISDDTIEIIRN